MVKTKHDITDKRLQKIGAKIKKLRMEAGYTSYEDFAWENELNRVQYWRMEKGSNFTINSLLKILDVHQLSLEEFFVEL
ncbi:MAG: hypothetical protein K0Q95_2149 [Bacteroidota bacterium]|jgi:hypothetical protein|nr:hypothetical protein [Bacteroidota bacterium]